MSFLDGIILKVVLEKGLKAAATAGIGFLVSAKCTPILEGYGVKIDPVQLQVGVTGGVAALTRVLIHFIEVHFFGHRDPTIPLPASPPQPPS